MNSISQLRADLRSRITALFHRRALRERLDEEMLFHIEMREQQLIDRGVPAQEARVKARKEFGNTGVLKETAVDMWRYATVERLFADIKYAVRMLVRTPAFTAVAVLSLALGIGANAAIFTLIDRLVLRFLPVHEPSQLVILPPLLSYSRLQFIGEHTGDIFEKSFGYAGIAQVGVDGSEDEASFAQGRLVSGSYFETLGVRPQLGRLLTPNDDRLPGGHPVIVISNAFWRNRYHGDPSIIGRTVRLSSGVLSTGKGTSGFEPQHKRTSSGGGQFTIIGVTGPGFFGETVGETPDFWAPLMMQEHFMPGRQWLIRKTAVWIRMMARVKPGIAKSQVQAALNLVWQQALLSEEGDTITESRRREIAGRKVVLRDGMNGFRGGMQGTFAQPLLVLMAMVGVVLLIACANLANLLLARASARTREISVRLALGAGRPRIVRQLLTESVVLAIVGGAFAVLVAWWGSHALFAMAAEGEARLDLTPDTRTFLFAGAVSLLTALLFGLAPALRATRVDVSTALKDAGKAVASGWGVGRALVSVQVALSVILLMGTALFTRTLFNMKAQQLGYAPEDLIIMRVDPVSAGLQGDDISRACLQLLDKIRTLPGVKAATFSENGLFSGSESKSKVRIEGHTPGADEDASIRFDQAGPDYFRNVGIPLLAGRDLSASDTVNAPRVAVINENMARFYFAGRNPIGRLIHYDDDVTLTIVGVAANAHDHDLRDEIHRRAYVSFMQPVDGITGANFIVRSAIQSAPMAAQMRAAVREATPGMTVVSVEAVTTLIDKSVQQEHMIARLSIMFGLIAALLASVGLYGVLSYSVTRRTNEIGIRMAIGAFPRNIVFMVARETMVLVLIGLAAGIPIALLLGGFIESLLFGVKPNDVWTIAAVVVGMAVVAIFAATGPARRAASIDPIRALRYE